MRLVPGLLASTMTVALIACGGGGGGGDDTADDDGNGSPDAGDPPPPTTGFQLRSPDIHLESGEEQTYCWYTTVDVDQQVAVKKWSSTMTQGSHHLIVYFTGDQQAADDTLTADCGGFGGTSLNPPVWTYSAQNTVAENAMPVGVGMTVQPQQHLFIQMHYLNATPSPIDAHVTVNAETYADGESYMPAAPFITFNTLIDLPPMGTGSAEGTCTVPSGVKFFTLSTHAHRRAIHTEVKDGDAMVFQSDDWEHPGATDWRDTPYYEFSGKLTYHCDYQNDLDQQVTTGDSAATDEMCMAVGYMFPATSPTYCLNSQTF